ncbi:TIGR02117 family protein [Pontibacter harenae]|uniref:TIGR02117 family protein n=1 Tax=Pontibacter harenae TaxID=2894083 RepID=UPI001E61D0FA|nr:TIGR02117 family protein [Pontibacter harenae]MCC9166102.1 TIGR02117 family protein [Pontibacter harenae]
MYASVKKVANFIKWVVLVLLGISLLFFVLGFILSSFAANEGFAQAAQQDSVEIFVTSNGVHTDLVLPIATPHIDWRTKLPLHHFATANNSDSHVAFGWGDRRFYIETPEWKDLTPGVAISAALWPTKTAMHVEYIENPLIPNKYQLPIKLSPEQYQELVRYVLTSFQSENGGFMLIEGAGYTGDDNFYEAHRKFYLLKNCNNWVNQGLKAAGAKAALWAPFPYAIMRHYR